MRSLNLKTTLAALLLVFSFRLYAEEEAADAGKTAAPLPKEQKEFFEKTQRLNSLTTRIEEDEKQFLELVRRKSGEKNADEKERIIKQMNEVSKDRNKSADEYNSVKSDLALHYPNSGEHLSRRYQTQTKKSVEELEGAAGLDELLTRTKKVIERKFAPFNDPEDEKTKVKAAQTDEDKPKPLRLEK
jgi:uncharacterized protein (DUF2267 family)